MSKISSALREELEVLALLVRRWVDSGQAVCGAQRVKPDSAVVMLDQRFPGIAAESLRGVLLGGVSDGGELDLFAKNMWIRPPIVSEQGVDVIPVLTVALEADVSKGVVHRRTLRMGLFRSEGEARGSCIAFTVLRYESAEPAGKPRSYAHVQNCAGWTPRGCALHYELTGGGENTIFDGASGCESCASEGCQLHSFHEGVPALPIPVATLPGMMAVALLSLCGAPNAKKLFLGVIEQKRKNTESIQEIECVTNMIIDL